MGEQLPYKQKVCRFESCSVDASATASIGSPSGSGSIQDGGRVIAVNAAIFGTFRVLCEHNDRVLPNEHATALVHVCLDNDGLLTEVTIDPRLLAADAETVAAALLSAVRDAQLDLL